MKTTEKKVTYETTNTYETLNSYSDKTKNVWLVFHGIGYLSRFFLKYFNELDTDENYIIAPQAPSKYYLNNKYVHVGASWLTKENTLLETENLIQYIDNVLAAENIKNTANFIIFGFSQGVSIATRYLAHKKLSCNLLVLYAGSIPNELKPAHFTFLEENNTKVKVVIGTEDEYINEDKMKTESKKINSLFKSKAEVITFDGGHVVKKEIINALI